QAMHALGRIGSPEDVAHAIVFFLSPHNNWITGQVLAVDGGLSGIRPKMKV
ncbi:MAG: SDR family oxidoreductase, partial [bacterium]|nr:SDR family oxidoreductase [bacterium]